jgi:addiction module HigA family antidote
MPRLPVHPGEILGDELEELGLSATRSAKILGVPPNRIIQILNGRRGISAETALRLARWLGTSPQFWLNLQNSYELRLAEQEKGQEIQQNIIPLSRPDFDLSAR